MKHKLSKIQSKEIYELAKDPNNKLSENAIAERYGVAVNNVRYHIAKWEKVLGEIAQTSEKLQTPLSNTPSTSSQKAITIFYRLRIASSMLKKSEYHPIGYLVYLIAGAEHLNSIVN